MDSTSPFLKRDETVLRRPRDRPAVTAPPRAPYTAFNSYQLMRREILSRSSGGEEAVR